MIRSKNLILSFLLIGLLTIFLVACGAQESKEADQTDEQTNDTTETTETTESSSSMDFAEAEKITKTSCIGCHGIDLKGSMGPDLTNLSLSKEEIVEVITKGRGSMPPATAKGNEEYVAEYLLSLK
ncbi:MAG TPA: cytochrome c [Ureibacillus sp.]|nr:cytochrome c [Ureibacillus sp.]